MVTDTVEGSPAYRSIARDLAGRIERGELSPGVRVPSERRLRAEYGVSLMTARAAVNLLGQRGLVERRARSGTFVARQKIELNLSAVAGFSSRLLRRGVTPGAEVIEARTITVGGLDTVSARALGLEDGDEPVHVVVRRRTGDGEPLALEESYFPARYCQDLLGHDLTGSIYELLRDRYGLEPARLRQKVELTQLDTSAAVKLGIRPDVPVLRVTRTACDVGGRSIEFARDLFRGDRLLFVSDTDEDSGDGL
ncbi:MAG: GntR family transcriptional regulator [Rubrobacter sp.]|nr:GntR family transcriptional regulator [Rubrobacter sp.]